MKWTFERGRLETLWVGVAVLCVVGLLSGVVSWPGNSCVGNRARLLVVRIGGFSWHGVLAAQAMADMPHLTRLLGGEVAYGDVISEGNASESELLASALTGKFPVSGGNTNSAAGETAAGRRRSEEPTVWDRIHQSGQPVAVVGFPMWRPLHGNGSLVVPATRQFQTYGVTLRDGMAILDPAYMSLIVRPGQVPESLRQAVVKGVALPARLEECVVAALADDLTITAMAEQAVRTVSGAHLFVCLSGLSSLDAALGAPDETGLSGADKESLLRNYHAFLDAVIARLDAAMNGAGKTMFVVSENGNRREPVDYRPGVPACGAGQAMGFFLAAGRHIRRTDEAAFVTPVDLATTWLYIAGVPMPVSMDGAILRGILSDEFFFQHPYRTVP